MTQQDNDRAKEQAEAQLASIRQMMAAASLDWEELEELRDQYADAVENCEEIPDELRDTLEELEEQAGEYASREEAEEAIYNNPLDISYRSGWSDDPNHLTPEEFSILLCTGGPAVRIVGEFNWDGQPHSARLEYQDWGTPWTMLFDGQSDALDYAQRVICL